MKKFCQYFLVFIFALCTLYSVLCTSAKAQVFTLSPSSTTKTAGTEFTVDVMIDTEGKEVAGADGKITFDADSLEVVRVENGDFFSDHASSINPGGVYLGGFFKELFAKKAGSGKMAVLTLKGKKAGVSQFNFTCTLQTGDTNILDASAVDIIRCDGVGNGTYTFTASSGNPTATLTPQPSATPTPDEDSGGSNPTATPAPTGRPASVPTATPPVSGVVIPTAFSFGAGLLLITLGLALVF